MAQALDVGDVDSGLFSGESGPDGGDGGGGRLEVIKVVEIELRKGD